MNWGYLFQICLLIFTFLTGIIWLISFFIKQKVFKENYVVKQSISWFPVLAIVFVVRSFLFEPYQIPSGSMIPTLKIGDFIIVKKYSYALKLPILNWTLLKTGKIKRGDVVVFNFPLNPKINFIKRVVGLPGDEILIIGNDISINGSPLIKVKDNDFYTKNLNRFTETLGQVKHKIYQHKGYVDYYNKIKIPEGNYFMMGDNRNDSNDSRFWGFVDERLIQGKALLIWMNWADSINFKDIGYIK